MFKKIREMLQQAGRYLPEPVAMPGSLAAIHTVVTIFVCDTSASMKEEGFVEGQTKLQLLHDACLTFLGIQRESRPQDWAAVVGYSTNASICADLGNVTKDYDELAAGFARVMELPHDSTSLTAGLRAVVHILSESSTLIEQLREEAERSLLVRLVCHSDGHDDDRESAIQAAHFLKEEDILIETFGIARTRAHVDEECLKQVATTDPDGFVHYRFLGDGQSVVDTFAALAEGTLTIEG